MLLKEQMKLVIPSQKVPNYTTKQVIKVFNSYYRKILLESGHSGIFCQLHKEAYCKKNLSLEWSSVLSISWHSQMMVNLTVSKAKLCTLNKTKQKGDFVAMVSISKLRNSGP